MTGLLRELLRAHKQARSPVLVEALQACGLPGDGVPIWGVEFVEVGGDYYQSRRGGHPAVIVPVFYDGALVDLTATGLATRRTVTRTGAASMLGQDAIDRAMDAGTHLHIFPDPIEWLRNRCNGAVVLDWRAAPFALSEVPAIACADELLTKKIDKALRQPLRVPPLYVREERRAAA
jgi:hypothetical protein